MTPDQLNSVSSPFLQQGIMGTLVVIAGWVAWYMYRQREADLKAHKIELAAKDALIAQLYEKRIEEKDAIKAVAQSSDRALEALAKSVNARMPV